MLYGDLNARTLVGFAEGLSMGGGWVPRRRLLEYEATTERGFRPSASKKSSCQANPPNFYSSLAVFLSVYQACESYMELLFHSLLSGFFSLFFAFRMLFFTSYRRIKHESPLFLLFFALLVYCVPSKMYLISV